MPILSPLTPLFPYSLESQSNFMELTSYVSTEFNIVSTIRWTQSFEDMLRVMKTSELHPFNRVRIIRHTKTGLPVRIQFIKDSNSDANRKPHPDSFHPSTRPTPTNSTPSTSAMVAIHNRNRGIHEPKSPKAYASWLELSQPKEKYIDSIY